MLVWRDGSGKTKKKYKIFIKFWYILWQTSYSSAKFDHLILLFNGYNCQEYKKIK